MHQISLKTLLLGSLLVAPQALAQTIDAKGADDIAKAMSAYVGKTAFDKKIFTITPQGSVYRLTFDAAPLVKMLGGTEANFKMDPFIAEIAPLPDGTWSYKASNFPPFSLAVNTDDHEIDYKWDIKNFRGEGIYDPKLLAFSRYSDQADEIRMVGKDQNGTTDAVMTAMVNHLTSTVVPGGLNIKMKQSMQSTNQKMGLILDKDDQPIDIQLNYGLGTLNASTDALRNTQMMNLWSFAITETSRLDGMAKDKKKAELKKLAPAIKDKLRAFLPLWDRLAMDGDVKDISIGTPFGTAKLSDASAIFTMSGVLADSDFRLGYDINGLELPQGLLPEWSGQFLPKIMQFNLAARMQGLDKVAALAIDKFDADKKEPWDDAVKAQMATMMLATPPIVTFPKSRIAAQAYDITYEGEVKITMPKPYGTMTITAKDYDKTIAAIQKAGESEKSMKEAATMAMLAKGFAKTGPDGVSTWLLVVDDKGILSVNGQALGPISK